MMLRKESYLKADHLLRAALRARGWENFHVYTIEVVDDKFDKNFSIAAFEGAIAKLREMGMLEADGYAVFEIEGRELGFDQRFHNHLFYVQVAN